MGRETESDLNGQCFFCLTKIVREFHPSRTVKLEDDMLTSSSRFQRPPSYSLRYMFLYLSMDRSNVFRDTDGGNLSRNNFSPNPFMARVNTSHLKVQLCEGCIRLNEKFTGLCRKLEKVQMEVKSCVGLINGKMLGSEKVGRGVEMGFTGKPGTMEDLRGEMMLRCSQNITQTLPRVKLTRTKIKNVQSHKAPRDNEHNNFNYGDFISGNIFNSTTGERDIKVEVEDNPEIYLNLTAHYHDEDDFEDPDHDQDHADTNEVEDLQRNENRIEARNTVPKPKRKCSSGQNLPRKLRKPVGRHHCKLCGKQFMDSRNTLRHHQTAHAGVRFVCNLCRKSFTQKHHLESHVQTFHFNLPRFKCDVCGKGFSQKSHVKTHINDVHLKLRKNYRIRPNLD